MALAPGGQIAIRDIVMETDRTRPREGALFAINMLVNTAAGGTFTFDEYAEDLQSAGFIQPQMLVRHEGMNAVIGAKAVNEKEAPLGLRTKRSLFVFRVRRARKKRVSDFFFGFRLFVFQLFRGLILHVGKTFLELDDPLAQRPHDAGQAVAEQKNGDDHDNQQVGGAKSAHKKIPRQK